ncbi:Uncharacterised protein [Serratia fonticola]|uniref:Uncharacterized protein n=1 Tax=Serratia fonticola TaxID=47917 RepID=A0A4U9UV69_SERFO|nr:Uncharacterised protein [Serratia fonticola]
MLTYYHVGTGAGFFHQRHMALMQIAHGGHQRNAFALLPPAADLLAQQWQGFR